jgi:NOP9-like PUF repeat domain
VLCFSSAVRIVLEFAYRRPAFMEAISDIQKNICSTTDDDLADLVSDSSAAPTLQVLLRVTAGLDIQSPYLLARLIGVPTPDDKKFAEPVPEADVAFLTSFCKDAIASHTMEAIVSVRIMFRARSCVVYRLLFFFSSSSSFVPHVSSSLPWSCTLGLSLT